MKSGLAAATAALALALLPGSAGAATYCVNGPCASGGTPQPNLQAALGAADATGERDRIEIGAGTITGSANDVNGNDVDIVGAGLGVTFLNGTSTPSLQLGEASSTVADLTIRLPTGASQMGMQSNASAQRIEVVPGPGTDSGTGVNQIGNATIRDSRIVLPVAPTVSGAYFALGLYPNPGQTQTVEDVTLEGYQAIDACGPGISNVRRVSVPATSQGIRSGDGTMNVSSTLVRASGNFARGFNASTNLCSGSPTLNLRHVTAVGSGMDSEGVIAFAGVAGKTATVNLRDGIVRGFSTDLKQTLSGGAAAAINASYSNFATKSAAPGSISEGPGNVNVDPGFSNPGAGDYRLGGASPLIDAGDPAPLDAWNSTLDLDRVARVADGNQDGAARSDMGAYERQPPAPPAAPGGGAAAADLAPAVTGFSMSNRTFRVARAATPLSAQRRRPAGTRFRLRLSEAARVAITIERKLSGVRVRVRGMLRCLPRTRANLRRPGRKARCSRYVRTGTLRRSRPAGASNVAFSGRLGRRALKPGSYRATIVATDAGGKRSTAKRLAFRVVKR